MPNFFTNLIDKVVGIFKSKDLSGNIGNFQQRIDTIITDLILPYAKPTLSAQNDRFRDLITLLDPQKYAEFVSVNRLFHAEIIGATKNSMLEKIMDPIHDRVRLVGATLILKHAPRQQEVYEENKFILEAFKSKDPVMVKFAIENHIKKAKEHIMKLAKDDAEKIILGPF